MASAHVTILLRQQPARHDTIIAVGTKQMCSIVKKSQASNRSVTLKYRRQRDEGGNNTAQKVLKPVIHPEWILLDRFLPDFDPTLHGQVRMKHKVCHPEKNCPHCLSSCGPPAQVRTTRYKRYTLQLNRVALRFLRMMSRLLDAQLLVGICAELSDELGEIVQSKAEDPFQIEVVGFGVEVLPHL